MTSKLAGLCVAAVAALSAVGCAAPDLQSRYEALLRDQDELRRQKADLEAELLAYQAAAGERDGGAPRAVEPVDETLGKAEILRRGADTVIAIPSDVCFASGASTLSREGERSMEQVVEYIRRHSVEGLIRIEGHSDTDPIRQTRSKYHCNWELSFERAHAVMHHLVEKGGMDPRRVVCESWGEFHPRESGNKPRNRRVEIVLSPSP